MTSPDTRTAECRPRVAGAREEEILDATVAQLLEVGYDRLTMDRVADHARASKATLYRRWSSKQSLVVDALTRSHHAVAGGAPDTGSLRGDLLALFSGSHEQDDNSIRIFGMVVTAMMTDPDFAHAFRERFLTPKLTVMRTVYDRAAQRGELAPGADPALLGPALAAILLHRSLVLGEPKTPDLVERVIDQIILPAATGAGPTPQETS
jgi:AcrR family transcriptional regulator